MLHALATMRSTRARAGEAPDIAIWIADPGGDDPTFDVDALLMKPDSRGTVRLHSADPTAPPRINLPGVREERDVDRLVEAYRVCLRGGQRSGDPPDRRRAADGRPDR